MRRPILIVAVAATAALVVLQAVSLFQVTWISPDLSSMVSVKRGRVWVWSGQAGDLNGQPGFRIGGWTGGSLEWKAKFERSSVLFVAPEPGQGLYAKRRIGAHAVVPVVYPLAAMLVLTGGLLIGPRLIAARRRARGRCPACGYNLLGSAGPCPECGGVVARLVRALRRWMGVPA